MTDNDVFDDELTMQQLKEMEELEKTEMENATMTVSSSAMERLENEHKNENQSSTSIPMTKDDNDNTSTVASTTTTTVVPSSPKESSKSVIPSSSSAAAASPSPSSSPSQPPSQPQSQPPPPQRSVTVTTERKNELLCQARTDRLQWIQSVPLPYAHEATPYVASMKSSSSSSSSSSLEKLQYSHVGMELPSAISILRYLQQPPQYATTTQDNNNLNHDDIDMKVALPSGLQLLQSEILLLENTNNNNNNNNNIDDDNDGNNDTTTTTTSTTTAQPPKYQVLRHYQSFLQTLVQPECTMLVQGLRNFVRKFQQHYGKPQSHPHSSSSSSTTTTASMAHTLKPYVQSTLASFQSHPAWRRSPPPQDSSTTAVTPTTTVDPHVQRSLESFLYGHLYEVLWNQLKHEPLDDFMTEDNHHHQDPKVELNNNNNNDNDNKSNSSSTVSMEQMEHTWMERLLSLQFVTPHHLEIAALTSFMSPNDVDDFQKMEDLLQGAMELLHSVNDYYSPYEKLQQILAVYHCANEALVHALNLDHDDQGKGNNKNKKGKKLPSADDILPTLILVVLRSKPTHLWMNLKYIEVFAMPEYLRGEAGYAYTNLYSAVQFIQDLNLPPPVVVQKDDDDDDDHKERSSGGGGGGTSLNISTHELQQGLQKCRDAAKAKAMATEQLAKSTTTTTTTTTLYELGEDNDTTLLHPLQVGRVRQARLQGETVDLDWALRQQQQQQQQQQQCMETTMPFSEQDLLSSSSRTIRTAGQQHTTTSASSFGMPVEVEEDNNNHNRHNNGHHHPPNDTHATTMTSSSQQQQQPLLPPGFTRTYSFLNTRPEDIRVTDLSALMKEYKMLVHTTELLLGERATRLATERKSKLRQAQQELEAEAATINLLEDS